MNLIKIKAKAEAKAKSRATAEGKKVIRAIAQYLMKAPKMDRFNVRVYDESGNTKTGVFDERELIFSSDSFLEILDDEKFQKRYGFHCHSQNGDKSIRIYSIGAQK